MKQFFIVILTLILLFSGCDLNTAQYSVVKNISAEDLTQEPTESENFYAVWFSYIDLYSVGLSETEFENKIDTAFENVANLGMNTVICQVRANGDAAYYSDIFPFSENYSGTEGVRCEYDPLEIMLKYSKKHSLSFHAWINPYRVRASGKVTELSQDNPARGFLKNGKPDNYNLISYNGGIYYNPQSEKVKTLILNGIEEILNNYDVDGIHIDDYFYPTDSGDFDKVSYDFYRNGTDCPLPLADWRRANVSTLISRIYRTVHRYGKKVFGISPSAHISNDGSDLNHKNRFAEVYTWMTESGYVDYIAPQLYFGYKYPQREFAFENLLKKWTDTGRAPNVKLYVGLAPYKIDTQDAESDEWITDIGLVARQTSEVLSQKTDGVIYYSYSSLFADTKRMDTERKLIKSALKKS